MPPHDGYAVLIGKVKEHHIDDPITKDDDQIIILESKLPTELFDWAINLKSRTEINVQYRNFRNLDRSFLNDIVSKPDGLHKLASNYHQGH